jgi:hypothetical protein
LILETREEIVRPLFALAASLAAATATLAALAQQPNLAPGRELLPQPYEAPTKLEGRPPPHPLARDPSGALSRTIFETDDDPNFKILIQDFSFPPDRHPHVITFPSGVFLHFFGEPIEIKIAGQPLGLRAGERTAAAADTQIEVVNSGKRAIVVRALMVKAK